MTLFAPRYKQYATWPVVIWCRLRRHANGGYFWSGNKARCVNCGDYVVARAALEPKT
jgi:hypothetical protein